MLPAPGVVVVWSREQPRFAVHALPADGVIGRDQIQWDDRLSRRHLRVTVDGDALLVRELKPKIIHTSAWLRRDDQWEITRFPAIVSAAHTVMLLVDDVGTYRSRLPPHTIALRDLEAAARAEDHVILFGGRDASTALAERYAALVGPALWHRPSEPLPLDELFARNPARVIVLELARPLAEADRAAITRLLETDTRFVVLASAPLVPAIPAELVGRAREITSPLRHDELPARFSIG